MDRSSQFFSCLLSPREKRRNKSLKELRHDGSWIVLRTQSRARADSRRGDRVRQRAVVEALDQCASDRSSAAAGRPPGFGLRVRPRPNGMILNNALNGSRFVPND
jgi:hypothetical protein